MENQSPPKQLYRSRRNRIIFGVCGGLGEYFKVDPVIVRVLFLLLTFGAGSGVLIYVILALLVPNAPEGLGLGFASAGSDRSEADFGKRVQGLAQELKNQDWNFSGGRSFLGLATVLFGVLLLISQIFPGNFFAWNFFWPIVFIAGGFYILTRNKKQ